jgi:hypothetical protein
LKKPTGSVEFRFYKPETEKTEPNRTQTKKTGKKTEPNRKKTSQTKKTEPNREKTEPNQKNRVKPEKTKPNRFEPVFVLKKSNRIEDGQFEPVSF